MRMPAPRAADSLPALSALLGAQLRARAAALAQEVRDYPTPIARCDDQLGGLLERRRRVFAALACIEAANQADAAATLAMLEACVAALAPGDLDAGFMAQWRAALGALRVQWAARPGGCGPADAWANDGGALA